MSDDSIMSLLWKRLGIQEEVDAVRENWPLLRAAGPRRVAKAVAHALLEKPK